MIFAFWLGLILKWPPWLVFIVAFAGFQITVYMWIGLNVDAKAKFVEKVLPDALQLMSSNLRAGLTPDRALLLSSRPEFGPLSEELNKVGREIAVGKEIDKALMKMTERIRSEKLTKTMLLIVSGLRSGGELASLLDQTARNLRAQEFVDQKIRSSIKMLKSRC